MREILQRIQGLLDDLAGIHWDLEILMGYLVVDAPRGKFIFRFGPRGLHYEWETPAGQLLAGCDVLAAKYLANPMVSAHWVYRVVSGQF